jgi:hypothetical protein
MEETQEEERNVTPEKLLQSLPDLLPRLPDTYVHRCSPEFKAAVLVILLEFSPDTAMQATALDELIGLCNRFAHALLLSMDLNAGCTTLVFHSSVQAAMVNFVRRGSSEQCKALLLLQKGDETGNLELPRSETTRWYAEYREAHNDGNIIVCASHRSLSSEQQVSLMTWIQFLVNVCVFCFSEFIYNTPGSLITVLDMAQVIQNTPELLAWAKYLGAPCTYQQAMIAYFRPRQAEWTKVHASSWYHTPAKVMHMATLYAHGQVQLGDEYFARTHGIRPLQFFGNHRSLDPQLRTKPPGGENKDDDDSSDNENKGAIVFSFALCDKSGVWVPFVCELRASRGRARFRAGDTGQVVAEVISVRKQTKAQPSNEPSELSRKTLKCRITDQALVDRFDVEAPQAPLRQAKPKSLWHTLCPTPISETWLHSNRDSPVALSCVKADGLSASTCASIRLENKFIVATQLGRLRWWTDALYTDNVSLAARVLFSATVVDVISQAGGLPVLPDVLLRIIGEYVPADDVPFVKPIEEEETPPPPSTSSNGNAWTYIATALHAQEPEYQRRQQRNLISNTLLQTGQALHAPRSFYEITSDPDLSEEEEEEEDSEEEEKEEE